MSLTSYITLAPRFAEQEFRKQEIPGMRYTDRLNISHLTKKQTMPRHSHNCRRKGQVITVGAALRCPKHTPRQVRPNSAPVDFYLLCIFNHYTSQLLLIWSGVGYEVSKGGGHWQGQVHDNCQSNSGPAKGEEKLSKPPKSRPKVSPR